MLKLINVRKVKGAPWIHSIWQRLTGSCITQKGCSATSIYLSLFINGNIYTSLHENKTGLDGPIYHNTFFIFHGNFMQINSRKTSRSHGRDMGWVFLFKICPKLEMCGCWAMGNIVLYDHDMSKCNRIWLYLHRYSWIPFSLLKPITINISNILPWFKISIE